MLDAVITYVDSKDPKWRKEYEKFVKRPLEEVENRFRSYDCLDLQIKLIRKNMSFVDNIFVIVSSESQVPDNIKELENVYIVTHKDIIPKRYLPCFNSCTIEMYMYNIKNLKENFIYFNDDVFVISKCKESDFIENEKIVANFELKEYDINTANSFEMNVINSNKLINKFVTTIFIKPAHFCFCLNKSHIQEIWIKHRNEIEKSLTRTRHKMNINFYAFVDYEICNGNYVSKEVATKYFSTLDNLKDIYECIKANETSFICVNDSYNFEFEEWKEKFRNILEYALDRRKTIKFEQEKPVVLDDTPLKVALCAIAKNENLYIREWVEWYKNIGISKIFLYDNNELDGERFEEVINDYIESGFVEVIDKRGIVKSVKSDKDGQTTQGLAYSDCYYSHYKEFDWIFFFDIDEYLEIYDKYSNLYEFLNDFNEYDGIRVQWKMYGDNDNVYYENKPLFERFKNESNVTYDCHVKQILNCKSIFTNKLLFCAHGVFNKNYKFVNVLKMPCRNVYMDFKEYTDLPVYLNHFYSKSTEEFLKRKYNKTSAVSGVNNTRNFNIEFLKNQYFTHNKLTSEKEKMFDKYKKNLNAINYDHIVISFTSYKERLSLCHLMVDSLLKNTIKPYKICLTVYSDDVSYISNELKEFIYNGIVELIVADKNLRPHLKYFYAMKKYRKYPIITVDDDCIFREDFIESLINSYKKYPNCVSARRVHKKTYDHNTGTIKNYEHWIRHFTQILLPSTDIVATGVGGVLYPPNILNITDDNLEDIYKYITVDDIYLHYLELKLNVPIVYVPNKKNHPDIIEGSQETALFTNINKANENDDNSPNNIAIKNLLNHI